MSQLPDDVVEHAAKGVASPEYSIGEPVKVTEEIRSRSGQQLSSAE